MAKVTGYRIRSALKYWELRLSSARASFENARTAFPGEKKPDPLPLAKMVAECELNIALLQEAQSKYNLAVRVPVGQGEFLKKTVSLTFLVKAVGGAGRVEKMWHNVARGPDKRHQYNEDRMQKDEVRAQPTIDVKVAIDEASNAAQYASQIRAAIAEGNSIVVEMDLPDQLLHG